MREVCFILINDQILRAYSGTTNAIPDNQARWQVIWEYREQITEIVHTHPGNFLEFSQEDKTTIQAVEAGTGKQFTWSIVTEDGYLSKKKNKRTVRQDQPWWLDILKELSFGINEPNLK